MLGLQKYTEDNSPFSNISLLFVAFVFCALKLLTIKGIKELGTA